MALDVSKIIQDNLPNTCYSEEVVPKSQIYLHHTAGGANPHNVISGWKTRTDKVSTAFIIAGKPKSTEKFKEGDIIQAFSSKCWGYHLGLKKAIFEKNGLPYKALDKSSIAVEICNWGFLTKEADGTFKNYVGGVVPSDEVVTYTTAYRGHLYYHKYSDAQLLALRDLLIYLCDKYIISKVYNPDMFDISKNALSGKNGIYSHTSVREAGEKQDLNPQPNLVKMLQNIGLNSL